MTDSEFQQFIIKELKDINVKLDNHITHIVSDISVIKTDIEWLKKDTNGKNGKESKDDIKTQESSRWLEKIIWWVIATMVAGFSFIVSLIVYHIYFSK